MHNKLNGDVRGFFGSDYFVKIRQLKSRSPKIISLLSQTDLGEIQIKIREIQTKKMKIKSGKSNGLATQKIQNW
jgi:hypothetical protein